MTEFEGFYLSQALIHHLPLKKRDRENSKNKIPKKMKKKVTNMSLLVQNISSLIGIQVVNYTQGHCFFLKLTHAYLHKTRLKPICHLRMTFFFKFNFILTSLYKN